MLSPRKRKPTLIKHAIAHHLDRRAEQLLAFEPPGLGHNNPPADDDLLTSKQVAEWFGVSLGWLEIGRCKGWGPDFVTLGPRSIRYTRGALKKFLRERTDASTTTRANRKRKAEGAP
jgi:hypothetical protein